MSLVMVVDDDPRIRTLLRRLLEDEGHDVAEAPDGEVAISLFKEEPADLVITDILMAEKDGCQTISELTREFPGLRCIAISGGAKIGPFRYLMMAKNCGALRVVTKPFLAKEILGIVREILEGSSNSSEETNCPIHKSKVKKSVLVVDPEPRHAWTVCEGLTMAGHSVTDTRSGQYAVEIMRQEDFEVVIVDVLSSRFAAMDLIRRLHNRENGPLTIAMADFESVCVRNAVLKRGADHFVGKPIDIHHVLNIISSPSGFSGKVTGVDILEYLQFLLLSRKKMLLEIRPALGRPCQLYIGEGKFLHAICGELEGKEAFYRSIAFQGGEFVNLTWQNPERLSIDEPGDFMLLEAARRRDESGPYGVSE
jgi:DNA-binding response OmpR family regulator